VANTEQPTQSEERIRVTGLSPRHRLTHVDAELSERITRLEIAHVQLFYVDVDRKKKIDDVIDYFGAGRIGSRRPAPEAARALMPASAASSMSHR
jgi:hypothetical protein